MAFKFRLPDAGIGPAMLDDVRVRYKGRDFAGDPYDFFVQQRPDVVKALAMGVDKLIPGRLVPAGEWVQAMGADGPVSEKAVAILTYSSVYGDQWHLRSDSFVPVPGPAPRGR